MSTHCYLMKDWGAIFESFPSLVQGSPMTSCTSLLLQLGYFQDIWKQNTKCLLNAWAHINIQVVLKPVVNWEFKTHIQYIHPGFLMAASHQKEIYLAKSFARYQVVLCNLRQAKMRIFSEKEAIKLATIRLKKQSYFPFSLRVLGNLLCYNLTVSHVEKKKKMFTWNEFDTLNSFKAGR